MKKLFKRQFQSDNTKFIFLGEKARTRARKNDLADGEIDNNMENLQKYTRLQPKERGYLGILQSQATNLQKVLTICEQARSKDDLKRDLTIELKKARQTGQAYYQSHIDGLLPETIWNMSQQNVSAIQDALKRFPQTPSPVVLDSRLHPNDRHAKSTLREFVMSDIESGITNLIDYQLGILDGKYKYEDGE